MATTYTVTLTDNDDTFMDVPGRNTEIIGLGGNDTLYGEDGDDFIVGDGGVRFLAMTRSMAVQATTLWVVVRGLMWSMAVQEMIR